MRSASLIGAALLSSVAWYGGANTALALQPGHPSTPVRLRAHSPDAALGNARRSPEKPFGFRGIELGITLDAFRSAALVRAVPAGSVPVCETDIAAGSLGMNLRSDDSTTVACRWAHRTPEGWQRSRAVVAGAQALDHVLRFAHAPGEREYRLYEMSFLVDERVAYDLRDALAERYGRPRVSSPERAETGGAAPIYVWRNASSSITLCFLPASRSATLTYVLDDSDRWLNSVARRWFEREPDAG